MRFKLKLYNAKFGVVKITGHWGKKNQTSQNGHGSNPTVSY